MMADLTAARAASTFPVFQSHASGLLCVAMGTIDITTNPTASDVLSMCKVPAGATVVDGVLYGPDLDTNAVETLDLDVGWAANDDEVADPDGFGNFGVVTGDVVAEYKPVAGIHLPLQGVLHTAGPKTFTAETTLTVTAVAGAATGGTGQLTLVVYYFVT
jgi:hypothetical protein